MDRNQNGLVKFITCGSVDDGKSTLIGHLLYDAKLLYADQKGRWNWKVKSEAAVVPSIIPSC